MEKYKKPHLVVTDSQMKLREKSSMIRKSVGKEIKRVEKMFPISLGVNAYNSR